MFRRSFSLLHDEQNLADGSHKTRPRTLNQSNHEAKHSRWRWGCIWPGLQRVEGRGLADGRRPHRSEVPERCTHAALYLCSTHGTTVQVTDSPQWKGVHGQITLLLQSLVTGKTYKQHQLEGQDQRTSSIQQERQSSLPRRQLIGAACRVVRAKSAELFEQVASGCSWPSREDEQASSTLLSKPEAWVKSLFQLSALSHPRAHRHRHK